MSKFLTVIAMAIALISMPTLASAKAKAYKPKSSVSKSHSSPKATHSSSKSKKSY